MAKIDPGLKQLLAASRPSRRAGASLAPEHAAQKAPKLANVLVELEDDTIPAALLATGFVPRTRAGRVLSGEIASDAISKLEHVPGLKRAERARRLGRELDLALPDANALALHKGTPPRQGEGVLVGVIDHGIDYQHRSFRNDDGTTRIVSLWDQGAAATSGRTPPVGFDYGVEYTRADINAALASSRPLAHVPHEDLAPFHGTHVAGIAAGNGRPGAASGAAVRYIGVAPRAELIIVANTRTPVNDPGSFGDSADTLDALAYILHVAETRGEGKPVAINLSEGDNLGPHDGTSLLEIGIGSLIDRPGRALIKSAGNEGATSHHAESVLVAGTGGQDVKIAIPTGQQEVSVDIWYPGANRIQLQVTPPGAGAAATRPFDPPDTVVEHLPNGNDVFVDTDLNDPGNGDNRIFLVLQSGDAEAVVNGTWTIHLAGSGPWHAWIQRNSGAVFQAPFVSQATTISIPGTMVGAITVASHISNDDEVLGAAGTLSEFSSRGPTRDGRRGITVSAPGEEIRAPQPGDRFAARKGTSMSAAMVTGAAALLLSIRPTLTADEIRKCLELSARGDQRTGSVPNNVWGAGKLDVETAAQRIQSPPGSGGA